MTKLCLLAVLGLCLHPYAEASTIFDGFEGASLDPFWTVEGPGTYTLTNTIAHSGVQSVHLQTVSTFPWASSLTHDFGSDLLGSVSVYMNSQLCCGASGAIEIDQSNGDWANIQELSSGEFSSRVSLGGNQSGISFSGSSAVWHLFQIDANQSGVTVKLDGNVVFTNPSFQSFRLVSIGDWGSPNGSASNFDDFSATVGTVAPEPASAVLIAAAVLFGIGKTALRHRPKMRQS